MTIQITHFTRDVKQLHNIVYHHAGMPERPNWPWWIQYEDFDQSSYYTKSP